MPGLILNCCIREKSSQTGQRNSHAAPNSRHMWDSLYQIKSAWERSREQERCWHDTTLQLCSGRGQTELAYLLTAGPEWGSPSVSLPHICTFSLIRHMHSLVKQSSSFRNSQHLQWSLLMPPWKPYWNRIHTVMVLKSTAFGEEDKSGRLRSGTNVLMNKNEGIVRTKQERTTPKGQVHSRHQMCCYLDLGLHGLQNFNYLYSV